MKKYLLVISLLIMPTTIYADDIELLQKPSSISLAGFILSNIVNLAVGDIDYKSRTQMVEALTLASGQKAAVAEYFAAEGRCPDNTVSNTHWIAKPSLLSGMYVAQVEVKEVNKHCTIMATMKTEDVNQALAGKTLTLTMTPLESVFMWECASNVDNKYLPAPCQQ